MVAIAMDPSSDSHRDGSGSPDDEGRDQVLASMVLGTIAGFCALGMSEAELREASGLPPEALGDPDALVEYEALVHLWEALLGRFPERPVGLTLARQFAQLRQQAMGVFGYAIRHCRDVRQAFDLFVRYCPMVFPRTSLHLEVTGGEARLRVGHEPRVLAMIEPVEMFVASLIYDLPGMNEQMPRPAEICFRHAPRHPARVYAEFLGDAVRFGADYDGFAFDAAALRLPVTGADPQIGRYLQQHAEAQLEAHAVVPVDAPLDARVRRIIDDNLMAGTTDQGTVARVLGMSPRTLQRRLEGLGTSFGRQLEEVRHRRALQLLALPRLSVGEVAFMLGYGNPRAFYRSFRRWTGQTPSEFRRGQEG